jgi:hypothetical protein
MTKRVRVHPETGKVLPAVLWIGGGIALIVLGFVLVFAMGPLASRPELIGAIAAVGVGYIGAFVAAYLVLRRYRRAPAELRLVCKGCRKRWKDDSAAQAVRWSEQVAAGKIILPYKSLPPGDYGHDELGLMEMDTCIYCGEPASVPVLHKVTGKGKRSEANQSWTFNLSFGLCDRHARAAKRNAIIGIAAFALGALGGIALVVLAFVEDPDWLVSGAVGIAAVLQGGWYGLAAFFLWMIVFPIGVVVMCGGIVMAVVRLLLGTVVKTMINTPVFGTLGVRTKLDTAGKQLALAFSRRETAADYAALNRSAIEWLVEDAARAVAEEVMEPKPAVTATAGEAVAGPGQPLDVCWFCQRDAPADGAPHNVVLARGKGDAREEQTVLVPRCSACEQEHKRRDPMVSVGLPVALLVLSGACVATGVLGSAALKGWAWVIGTIVAFVGLSIVVYFVQRAATKRFEAAGTRPTSVVPAEHAGVKELLQQKWKLDTTKTGKVAA